MGARMTRRFGVSLTKGRHVENELPNGLPHSSTGLKERCLIVLLLRAIMSASAANYRFFRIQWLRFSVTLSTWSVAAKNLKAPKEIVS